MNKSVIPYEVYTDGSAKGNDPALPSSWRLGLLYSIRWRYYSQIAAQKSILQINAWNFVPRLKR